MTPLQALQERFGFDDFRAGQKEVIDSLLQGQGAAAVFPTGAGKSLCYQLPAILLPHLTLVVSPLLALMKDQVDALHQKGIEAARLDSSLTAEEYSDVLKRARRGDIKLLYVAPERFNNERFRQSLSRLKVSLMAVDEAHCVSEWGHNFRPDYLKLSRYARACKAERILALTATATPQVLQDICQRFQLDKAVRTPFHRSNLHLRTTVVTDQRSKLQQLLGALRSNPKGPVIVYVTLQRTAVEVAESLSHEGFDARPYHAGLEPELRAETQEWFLQTGSGIVVATIAFGMGIDKPDIRAVYHYDPPKSLENYSQEIGRAGRDGETSICHVFYFPPDRIPLENFVYGDTPNRESLQGLLSEVFDGREELILNLYQLGRDHDLRPLVLRTLLTYLELDGYLDALTPVYASYRFKPSASSKEILDSYVGEEQRFLASVLRHSVKKKIWFEIDIDVTAQALGSERGRVVGILDRCALDGWMEINASNLRFRYSVLQKPRDLASLTDDLFTRAEEREQAEIVRLRQALQLATSPGCLARRLAHHFGEELECDCGTCTYCQGEFDAHVVELQEGEFTIGRLPNGLKDPRTAARFLCGLTSPALQKLKLTKHEMFGRLSHISFGQVMKKIASSPD
jgi:ATP-dependent DNA helicase RecQ